MFYVPISIRTDDPIFRTILQTGIVFTCLFSKESLARKITTKLHSVCVTVCKNARFKFLPETLSAKNEIRL